MAIDRELRDVAQEMVDQYGWSALDDRLRVVEWIADRRLLSTFDDDDERADREVIEAVESHMRWLLS